MCVFTHSCGHCCRDLLPFFGNRIFNNGGRHIVEICRDFIAYVAMEEVAPQGRPLTNFLVVFINHTSWEETSLRWGFFLSKLILDKTYSIGYYIPNVNKQRKNIMGYTTDFNGRIKVTPPMSAAEVKYINAFSDSRRMDREAGPYYVGGSGEFGQGHDSDIREFNRPDESQPSLWCGWCASEDGEYIEWNGTEKFYESPAWMEYILNHFLCENPIAKNANSKWLSEHLQGHTCNGIIEAQGEEPDDQWTLVVQNNRVSVVEAGNTLPAPEEMKLLK